MPNSTWMDDLADLLKPEDPANVASAFAGVRGSVPIYAALYSKDASGPQELAFEARNTAQSQAQRDAQYAALQKKQGLAAIPDEALRKAVAARMSEEERYPPALATRRADFAPQPRHEMRQYAEGGAVRPDFTQPDMAEGGAFIPDQEYQKGGGVKKSLQQMAEELFSKGVKTADTPDLARRSLFGLKAQPALDLPLARMDDIQKDLAKAPAITEKSVTIDPGQGAAKSTLKSLTETPMSRRAVMQTAAGQVLRHAIPGLNEALPTPDILGEIAKIAESVATPGLAATKANIPGLVAMAIKQGMNADEAVAFVTSQFRKPPKFGGIMAQGEDPAEYFAQHIEDLHNRFEEPFVNYSPDITGAVRPGKAFQEMIGREDERIKPLALKPVMRGLQQADPDKYRELIQAAKDRSMASVETLLSYPNIDPDVVQRYMRGELRSLPPSYRDKLGYDEYAGGGRVRKTLQQMAEEMLGKGIKTADTPDLARRSLFGLKAQPALDLPLARMDDIKKDVAKDMGDSLSKAPTVSEKSAGANPATSAAKSTLQSLVETPMSRRGVLSAAAGQVLRHALPGVGDVVPTPDILGEIAKIADVAKPVQAAAALPVTLESILAGAIGQGVKKKEAVDLAKLQFPGYDSDQIIDTYKVLKNPYKNVDLDEDVIDMFEMSRPAENMKMFTGAPSDSPLFAMRPYMRALKQASPKVYDTAKAYSKDTAMDSVEGMLHSGLLRNEDEVARYLRNDPSIYDLIERRQ